MKKTLLLSLLTAGIIVIGWEFYSGHLKKDIAGECKKIALQTEKVVDMEDGILLAQKQEFELTKDINLGFIPKYRLIEAVEELKRQRALSNTLNNPTSVPGLLWSERGPNTDATGPSNGNTRANNGVTSGRMRAIWVDLADPSNHTVWVGGVDGGLWKTPDISAAPATWSLVNDFYSNLSIGSICQDPNSAGKDIMYFGTGEKTINSDAVRGGGIWKSTNHGISWSLLPSTTTFWNVSKIICDALGNVYVATMNSSGTGIERSTDGGSTWTNITPTALNTAITDMKLSSTGRMHIVGGYYGNWFNGNPSGYRYTDNPSTVVSGTWASPITPFPNVLYNVELAVSGSTIYSLPSNSVYQTPQVYKSTDGGVNWAPTPTSPPAASGTNDLSSGQAWYNIALGVDPLNPLNVVAGGLNCYRTIDGGTTWTQTSRWVGLVPSYVHADQQTIAWNGNQVLVGTDGGIFYSNDGGLTFTDRNTGLRLKQFYSCAIHPTTTNYFLAGAQDNGVDQLTNAGLGGSIEVTGGDGGFVHIDQDEPQFQFGSYVYNNYWRTNDGGNTWSYIGYGNTGKFINPTDYDDINNKLYGAWSFGNYFRWDNIQTGTTAWLISMPALGNISHVMKSHYTANRVFFGSDAGQINKVDNANFAGPAGSGTPTSTNITGSAMSGSTVSCIAIGTTDNNLLATFSNYGASHVWYTGTGGGAAGWTNITGNLPDIPVRWAVFYPEDNTKAVLATEMGIYETSFINGAATLWTQDNTFPVVRTDMIKYRPSDGTFLAATHGRGLYTSTLSLFIPYVRFAFDYNSQPEQTVNTLGCRNYKDYVINMKIDKAPTGNAVLTLSSAGIATLGVDYDFTTNGSFTSPSSLVTFASGTTTPVPVTIRIYDDAEVESTESFALTYTIAGGTNAQAAPSSTSYTFTIVDNDLTPIATPIDSTLGHTKTEHIASSGSFYFYATANGNLISSLSNVTATLGCVTSSVFEVGNVWQPFYGGQRSQKVIDITPTNNTGTYTVGLYYTTLELAGNDPTTLRIAKTTASTLATATPANTVLASTSVVPYGSGYLFKASFTGFSKFFLSNVTGVLPVTLVSLTGNLNNKTVLLNWTTSSEYNLKNFEIQKSADGINFRAIGAVNAVGNSNSINAYHFNDGQVDEINYYRLKMIDLDGHFANSASVLIKNINATQQIWVGNNPFHDIIKIHLSKVPRQTVKVELVNLAGAILYNKEFGKSNDFLVNFSGLQLSSAAYFLRTIVDGTTYITKVFRN